VYAHEFGSRRGKPRQPTIEVSESTALVPVSPVVAASNSPLAPPRRRRAGSPLVLAGSAFAGGVLLALLRSRATRTRISPG
jgi:hypothetical protein